MTFAPLDLPSRRFVPVLFISSGCETRCKPNNIILGHTSLPLGSKELAEPMIFAATATKPRGVPMLYIYSVSE
jgi:hypothetical protein